MDKFELEKILSEDRKKYQDKLDKINDKNSNRILFIVLVLWIVKHFYINKIKN